MRIQLSENFYLDEFTYSITAIRHGIDIVVEPDSVHFERIQRFVDTIAQPLRDEVGRIDILSGYRPLEVNRKVGSNDDSQHIDALAADLSAAEVSPLALCKTALHMKLPFDQLIHEYGRWCHASICKAGTRPRAQDITSYLFKPVVGKPVTKYSNGLVSMESLGVSVA